MPDILFQCDKTRSGVDATRRKLCKVWRGALLESVVRRGSSDEWESEEEEEENADRSDLADVVVVRVVRGANASPKISAPSRRLVSGTIHKGRPH